MINLEQQNELFKVLGEKLKKRIECYVIGGSAMMYHGMKPSTKDIDLVFDHEKDREEVEKILKNIGYKERETRVIYFGKKNTPLLLQRDEARFDLFLNKIISTVLSEGMKERVELIYEYDDLIVKVISPEDIIITKCATERAGDRKDAAEIIEKVTIKWDQVIEESIYQASVTPYIFPVFLFDFLEELKEDLKAEIPKKVLDEIRKIGEDMMEEKLKKK